MDQSVCAILDHTTILLFAVLVILSLKSPLTGAPLDMALSWLLAVLPTLSLRKTLTGASFNTVLVGSVAMIVTLTSFFYFISAPLHTALLIHPRHLGTFAVNHILSLFFCC
jgi:hypothetical protein